jgi:uncharacterized protein YdaU (DUF1376 family)
MVRTEIAINYYKRHIGDYLKATLKLTMLQDGAYNRLLDLYYSDENPLPLDKDEIYTTARCQSRYDKDAVYHVLMRFFVETDEGYRHKRCDAEIEAAKPKTESNRVNGKLGGRPKKQSEHEPTNNPLGFYSVTQTEPIDNLSHKPVTNNHKKAKSKPSAAFAAPVGISPELWDSYLETRRKKRASNEPETLAYVAKQIADFRSAGHDVEALVRGSVIAGWAGVFEPKANAPNGHGYESAKDKSRRETIEILTGAKRNDDRIIDITPSSAPLG